MSFSDRMGISKPRSDMQIDGMDNALRMALWNVLTRNLWGKTEFLLSPYMYRSAEIYKLAHVLWEHLDWPVDQVPKLQSTIVADIRAYFFSDHVEWFEVYDFVEFVFQLYPAKALADEINAALKRKNSGYRVIDKVIAPITSDEEEAEIETALQIRPSTGLQEHIRTALELLAKRPQPDYRNSIKESISAIESVACDLTNNPKAGFSDALSVLERNGELHGALKRGFTALYGYTSDTDGVRHAITEGKDRPDLADARFFLVACSAFANYLISKHEAAK